MSVYGQAGGEGQNALSSGHKLGSTPAAAGAPRFWRANRTAIQWALVVALGIIAVAYYVMPVRAELNCPVASFELWDARAC
jgi:hypothetical protein